MSNANSTFLQETAEGAPGVEKNALESISPPHYVTFRNQMQRNAGNNDENSTFETSVLKILNEMQDQQAAKFEAMHKELAVIKAQNDIIRKKQTDLENSMMKLSENYNDVLERLEKLEEKEKINEVSKNKLEQDALRVNDLETQLEEMNRKMRVKTIEIKNIPYQKEEKLMRILQRLFTALNIEFKEGIISDVYRVANKDIRKCPIIVELNNLKNKTDLLGALKNYNKQHRDSPFSTENLQIQGDKVPIYISHYLTPAAARLFFVGRNLKKQRNYKYCWSSLGKIFVKTDDNSPAIQLKNEEHVQYLMNQ